MDTKSRRDRIPEDRTMHTAHNRIKVYLLIGLIMLNGIFFSSLMQCYLESFHVNREAMQEKFYPIAGVEEWHLIVVNK